VSIHEERDTRHWEELEKLIGNEHLTTKDILTNWQSYVRRRDMTRFLSHYELFKEVIGLPGSIVELGVFKGASFFTWSKLLETFCPGDRTRKVYGFDHFEGLVDFVDTDGVYDERAGKTEGGWKATKSHATTLIELHNQDNFLMGVERCRLIEGNILDTVENFIKKNPGLRISLLHFDMDIYEPTVHALRLLYPLVVRGGVVVFDQYAIPPWEGETKAVDEFLKQENIVVKKHPFTIHPSGWFKKP